MKRNMKIKLIITTMLITLAVPVGVYASDSRTVNLKADYATGKGVLKSTFHWAILDNDSANAYTEIIKREENSPTAYRVAVRLETWETSKKCTKYVYKKGKDKASVSASARDVYQFASRHSIDNDDNTKELAVSSIYKAE